LSLGPEWSGDAEADLQCLQVVEETHDVRTFILKSTGHHCFRYLPGQFITLELMIQGQAVRRCYTLSSTPTRPECVSITVKRVPGGLVSNWLHDHLHAGDRLSALGPSGDFSCFAAPAPRYLFISGGSGVTPLMSMTRALHDLGSDADLLFVHCARTPADVLFADELALMARRMPRLQLAFVCENRPAHSSYAGHLGRLDAARLVHIAPDLNDRDVYTCGPAPFMAAVSTLLKGCGYDLQRYREESFDFGQLTAPPEAPALEPSASSGFQVRLNKRGDTFTCRPDQTVLQAATAAGVRLPSSCSDGVCGTCKTLKLSGEVDMHHKGGIRAREVASGQFLPCCSRPRSDLVLDR
jgi:ferredoxin-NADP reductase